MSATIYLDGAVTTDPEILGGAPVFSGTRVPIENLFDFIAGGFDLNGFVAKFPRVKLEFAKRVLEESSAAMIAEIGARAA